ncbi:winged helix-turn-helix transcriptional regulator [Undibacterium sp. TJN25]|uniref:winged helix-turn-helix transcriptional regulator n=1 Tax=Undibacterium sp. TJN25 TaxID=3413056 RepID=UPI003BF409A5
MLDQGNEFALGERRLAPQDCEYLRQILARVGDKWTIVVLDILGDRCMRFNDLHRSIAGISQRMLVVTLRHLERDGLLARTVYATVPPRVEYKLSERGHALRHFLEQMGAWALIHRHAIDESRRCFDLNNKRPGNPS